MSDSALPALKGIIDRLESVAGVTSLVSTRIYTEVPEKPTYPFIIIRMESVPFAAKDFSDQEHTINIQAFSLMTSPVECLSIRGAVWDALDRQAANITVAGKNVVKCNYSGLAYFDKEPDGITWQSLVSFVLTIN